MKNNICFIVQRYGLEVNGGAELLTRQIAEKMQAYYDIDVLTSKAIDYQTWKNEYEKDEENINGIHVKRFPVVHPRNATKFGRICRKSNYVNMSSDLEAQWLEEQGPYIPSLIDYLKNHKDDYAVFVFFTYLYYPTVAGVNIAPEKSIVVPFAHDEPFLKMRQISRVFTIPRALCFETEEERALIRKEFNNFNVPYTMLGAGVDIPNNVSSESFKKNYHLDHYIIYVGRIDEGKNCHEMFDYFIKYKKQHPSELKLVLMGKPVIDIPKREDILSLGFVSDEEKFNGISGADFLLLPSKFESLSMVVLEAFQLGVPVLVNGGCEVLRSHCIRSGGGYYYTSYYGFAGKTNQLLFHEDLRRSMGEKGLKYVQANYNWEIICRNFKWLIDFVLNNTEKINL